VKGASILPTVSAFAGRHSKGVSGRSADGEGALQFPHHDGSVTRAPRRRIEEGNRRLVRQSFTRVSSPISHSSHPQGWIVELGLPRWKRQGRTPHDESRWLAFDSSGDRGSAGTRAGPSGSVCGRGSIARKGVLARLPTSEHGKWELPGNGQVSLQKSFGGVLVQRSVVPTTHKSWCHGVTGDLARGIETAWRHVA